MVHLPAPDAGEEIMCSCMREATSFLRALFVCLSFFFLERNEEKEIRLIFVGWEGFIRDGFRGVFYSRPLIGGGG